VRPGRLSIGLLGPAPGVNAFFWVSGVLVTVLILVLILVTVRARRRGTGWDGRDRTVGEMTVLFGVG
jgi:hypothetical protein